MSSERDKDAKLICATIHCTNTIKSFILRNYTQPIVVSEYRLTQSLPDDLKASLPLLRRLSANWNRWLNHRCLSLLKATVATMATLRINWEGMGYEFE